MLGLIHSIESMGLVDGPGIRVVVFMQGCTLRCKYCHNPDMWQFSGGKEYTPEELLKKLLNFKTYFEASGGGVTFSGGEPMAQKQFLYELVSACKSKDIHTAIETSMIYFYPDILSKIDLIMASQLSEEVFMNKCQRVVNNDASFDETCTQLDEIIRQLGVL